MRPNNMVVAVEVVVEVVENIAVVALVVVEVEVVDLMTPTDHSLLNQNGMSLLVKERGCS
jgi:hypothetical protein